MILPNLFISLLIPPAAVSNANSQSALNIKRGGNKPEREDFYRLHLIFSLSSSFYRVESNLYLWKEETQNDIKESLQIENPHGEGKKRSSKSSYECSKLFFISYNNS